MTPPGGGTASVIQDCYQLGHLAYQTDGTGTLLASYTDDSTGAPISVQPCTLNTAIPLAVVDKDAARLCATGETQVM